MEKYEKIKQIGKKYLAPAIVTGALAFGINAYVGKDSLPVYNKTREVVQRQVGSLRQYRIEILDNLVSDFHKQVESARDQFNESISDGVFDESEQRTVHRRYEGILRTKEKLKSLFKEYRIQESEGVELSAQDNKLYKLLDKNLKGIDIGRPNLEKCLRSDGLDVVVNSVYNRKEKYRSDYVIGVSSVCAMFGAIFSLVFIANRTSRKNSVGGVE